LKEDEDKASNVLWVYPNYNAKWCNAIIKEFNIHPVTAQVLVSRGFSNFEEIYNYLYAKLPHLHSPDLLIDMDKAVNRIIQAMKKKEVVLIYGDNDVDGITGTALLVELFRQIGLEVYYYIPHRTFSNLSMVADVIGYAEQKHCTLLITVDCGINTTEELDRINENKIDVIISDHHEPTHAFVHCVANLNPKLSNSSYPNRELTGVGVAFKLAHSLINHLVSEGKIGATTIDLKKCLDLVALGTIADMGALVGENRILVRYGLKQFSNTKRVGLVKLMEICNISPAMVNPTNIASKIAPRLNSLGRIANPLKGVKLMLTDSVEEAYQLAYELEKNNAHRKQIERGNIHDVETLICNCSQLFEDKALVLCSTKWHPGIIPLIAARISKQYNRPTVIIAIDGGVGKGSIRTIPEFPLLSVLQDNAKFFIKFGGHNCAAGFEIKEGEIPEFKKSFISTANRTLYNVDIVPKLYLDSRVKFEELTFEFLDSLQLLEPHGTGNPSPMLYSDVTQTWIPKVFGKMHLKLYLEQNDRALEGIGFGMSQQRHMLAKKNIKLQIAFTPYINVFLNKSSIQLFIKGIKKQID